MSRISVRRAALYVFVAASYLFASGSAKCQQMASDGAIALNIKYEAGTSPEWYIEEQRYGAQFIEQGIAMEDPSQIDRGFLAFDWGFAKMAPDGGFPGTGDGSLHAQWHSGGLFVEAAARACLELRAYKPATYRLSRATAARYAAKIAAYSKLVTAAAQWEMAPALQAKEIAFDSRYTHRSYLHAALFAEVGSLVGDSSISAEADPFVAAGLSKGVGAGWRAGITQNPDGTSPPATLIAPGRAVPAGFAQVIDADGVNPELRGYDVSYQCVGLLFASRWLKIENSSALAPQVEAMLDRALAWEAARVGEDGSIDWRGSTRVGRELTYGGQVKVVDVHAVTQAFLAGSELRSNAAFHTVGTRIMESGDAANSSPFSADGAVGMNAQYEAGARSNYSIGVQRACEDWISAGVRHENSQEIGIGVAMLTWGFAHQAPDGSFPKSATVQYGAAQFLEAAANSVLLLRAYKPSTYQLVPGTYGAVLRSAAAGIDLTARWLCSPANSAAIWQSQAGSTMRRYLMAAALLESAAVTGDSPLAGAASPFLMDGLGLQQPDGTNPENGAPDANSQAAGIVFAERCSEAIADASVRSRIEGMLQSGLAWEMAWIDPQGKIVGVPYASRGTMSEAYHRGASITYDRRWRVVAARLDGMP